MIIIQTWFRRRKALLEIRRKAAWTIYQNIEYAGEQDQLKVIPSWIRLRGQIRDICHDLVVQFLSWTDASNDEEFSRCTRSSQSPTSKFEPVRNRWWSVQKHSSNLTMVCVRVSLAEELELVQTTAPDTIPVDNAYQGPRIKLPITKEHLESLILAFQRKEVCSNHRMLKRSEDFSLLTDSPCSLCSVDLAWSPSYSQAFTEREYCLYASIDVCHSCWWSAWQSCWSDDHLSQSILLPLE